MYGAVGLVRDEGDPQLDAVAVQHHRARVGLDQRQTHLVGVEPLRASKIAGGGERDEAAGGGHVA